jgi:anti-sigma B factor antagonist
LGLSGVTEKVERSMAVWQSSAWADLTEEDGTLVLRLGGELDAASRAAIEPAAMAAISSGRSVTFDLRELTFCDSTGIAMLIAVIRAAEAERCALTACNISPSVRRVFDIVSLGELIALSD